jgi:PAS domain S-box-containing protein
VLVRLWLSLQRRTRSSFDFSVSPVVRFGMTTGHENAARRRTAKRSLSMAQTLSLLTTAVVLSVLTAAIALTWVTLTQSAVEVTQNRLSHSVQQLAGVSAASIRQSQSRYSAIASDVAIHRALAANGSANVLSAAREALGRLQLPTDSGTPIELWRAANGKRVTFVGDDIPDSLALHMRGEDRAPAPRFRPGLDSITGRDSLQFGALYTSGPRTYFWIALPVLEAGRPVGFIMQQRRIAANPQTDRTVRELTGDSVSGFYHNADGSAWTTFGGVTASPPLRTASHQGERERPGAGHVLFAESRIAGTPLVLAMEVSERSVLARPREVVRRLSAFAVVLTLVGALLAWLVGRRVGRPLVVLTEAAESVAQGDYATRVSASGGQEVGRLASSFNRMAEQIGESRADLQRREEELRALADAIPQLAWMADQQGSLFWFNRRWYEYTGLSSTDAGDSQWSRAHETLVFPEVARRWNASVKSGEPFEMEVRLRRSDGEFRWFLTRVAPVRDRDGTVARWFGTSTDIQAMREARESAETANRAKSDFLAAMSHELRTPLNAIGGYAELIEMEIRGPISAEQRRDLGRIRSSQQHLLGLIGGVLDLSRIESGKVQYAVASVALDPVLASLEALVAPQAASRQQVLDVQSCPADLVVSADREKLRQILLNLLSNAVRHTPSGSVITVSARPVDAATVDVVVQDSGNGIPADKYESVFEPFVQLDRSLTQIKDGVGLGLAISRDLARGMGGDLRAAQGEGPGACFVLTLARAALDDTTIMVQTMETPVVPPRGHVPVT